jgi:dephospho-CoA kinase
VKPLVVGVVGGIGAGKSALTRALARRGARVIVGDDLGHEALRQPALRDAVLRRWPGVKNEQGEVDRKKLGKIVFADAAELKALEALVHPWIKRRIAEEVQQVRAEQAVPLVVLDAAVLLEAGWDGACDRLIFVDAPRALRLARLAARGWTERDLQAREEAQLPLTEKRLRADHVLENSSTLEDLQRQVDALLPLWGQGAVPPAGPECPPPHRDPVDSPAPVPGSG